MGRCNCTNVDSDWCDFVEPRDGYVCSRARGHKGKHRACSIVYSGRESPGDLHNLAEWENPSKQETKPENKDSILDTAKKLTGADRRDTYGPPTKQHELTMELYAIYRLARGDKEEGAVDTCIFNILQKISRYACGPGNHRDTWVDIAGYAANAAECEGF